MITVHCKDCSTKCSETFLQSLNSKLINDMLNKDVYLENIRWETLNEIINILTNKIDYKKISEEEINKIFAIDRLMPLLQRQCYSDINMYSQEIKYLQIKISGIYNYEYKNITEHLICFYEDRISSAEYVFCEEISQKKNWYGDTDSIFYYI